MAETYTLTDAGADALAAVPVGPMRHDDDAMADDLAAVGLPLTPDGIAVPTDADAPRLDALASELLRQVAILDADAERLARAQTYELQLVQQRYAPQLRRVANRRAILEGALHAIAARADFGKRAKSRAVAWGRYGRKTVPGKVEVQDAAALTAWASATDPSLLRATVTVDVPTLRLVAPTLEASATVAVSKSRLNEYVKQTGEEPPGTVVTAPTEVPYFEAIPLTRDVAA